MFTQITGWVCGLVNGLMGDYLVLCVNKLTSPRVVYLVKYVHVYPYLVCL